MKGAIDIFRGWREICNKHKYFKTIQGEVVGVYAHCCNCELLDFCRKKLPSELTDEDILDLVNKIGGTKWTK